MDMAKGTLGDYGSYDAAIDAGGIVTVSLEAKVDILKEMRKLVFASTNKMDDKLFNMIAAALGRSDLMIVDAAEIAKVVVAP